MELHMLRKHQFPAPSFKRPIYLSRLFLVSSVPPVIETFPELLTRETDQIYLEAGNGKMDSTICDSAEDINFNLNCVDQMDFESHFPGNVALTPLSMPQPIPEAQLRVRMSDPPRPCFLTSRSPLCCSSPCALTIPPFRIWLRLPKVPLGDQETSAEVREVSVEVKETSSVGPDWETELCTAVNSILPESESNPAPGIDCGPVENSFPTPGIISGPALEVASAPMSPSGPIPDPSLFPVAKPDLNPADDILAQVTAAAQIDVDETPDWEAIPLPPTVRADPRYFFFGAPSMEDQSPHARLIYEARGRAERG